MSIAAFITRCDAYCKAAEVSRTWLSKRLFSDTYRIEQLSKDEVDIGVKRLERAGQDLATLEDELALRVTDEAQVDARPAVAEA